jgi:putative ABC transport system substrate-binding protein
VFRKFIPAALAALLFGIGSIDAQQAQKIARIGYISSQSLSADASRLTAFRQGLLNFGYAEGKNIIVEYRFAEGNYGRLPDFATELVRRNLDLIVTTGAPPTRAVGQATRTIPVVMTVVGDPVELGFVKSLSMPGGNITGLTQMSPQLSGKRLELLKEAFPKLSRVTVFVDATTAAASHGSPTLRETEAAAETLGIKIQSLQIQGPNPDFDGAFRSATRHRPDALVILAGPIFELDKKRIVDLAAKTRLPAMYFNGEFVGAGGLMSYAPDLVDLFRRAALYVDKILKGANAADLPIEQPTKFELVINLKIAKQLGLTIPPQVLARADRVIK